MDYSNSTKQLRYIFNTPRDINGSFRFEYSLVDNETASTYSNGAVVNGAPVGYVLFVIEFIGSTTL